MNGKAWWSLMKLPSNEKPALGGDGLVMADLLADLTAVSHHLTDRLAVHDVLDSYLLSAAAVQIVEDYLQRDVFALRRGSQYLRDRAPAATLPAFLDRIADSEEWARSLWASRRRAARWRDEAAALRDSLAMRVVADGPAGALDACLATAVHLRARLLTLPRDLTAAVPRLPSCFRSFDQEPADMVALASRFRLRHPDCTRPVVVLGVRTSGSYLAPLVAAALHDAGYREVFAETARPGHRLRGPVAGLLRSVARRGGHVAIVDDPPATGGAVAAVARLAQNGGVARHAITLLLPLFTDDVPGDLTAYRSIVLPYREWGIHERLETESVLRGLAPLLGDDVSRIYPVPRQAATPGREHARAVFDVQLAGGERRRIVATGAGVGYLGRHAIAVARALGAYLPRTYGFADGLVFRDWLPDDQRLGAPDAADTADLAGYVRARAAAMPAGADRAAGLSGRQPVWEAASRVLQHNYGRAGLLLRPILLDPLVRQLCAVARPSVVDGATGLDRWYRGPVGLRKIDADVRDFANTDLACYDPVYDLAGIDPGSSDTPFVESLRGAMPCDPERFLLYELVHLWDRARDGARIEREGARAVQRYLRETVLAGTPRAARGPLCALDIDGVLESDALGFPMPTPTAAIALRALLAHGFRAVVATGRSLDEVRERCLAYGLAGGVAEYGSVVYHGGVVEDLVAQIDQEALNRVRARLRTEPGVVVDADYRHIVRARAARGGAVPTGPAARALGADAARVTVISGAGQTDFVATSVDKGAGLAVLADRVGAEVAWAIGDSAADLPMLRLAAAAYAPANADERVRASGVAVLGKPYAAGVAAAVAELIGHKPGRCETCCPPPHAARTRTMLTLLDASSAGARGLPTSIARCVPRLRVRTP